MAKTVWLAHAASLIVTALDRQTLHRAYTAAYSKEGNHRTVVRGIDFLFLGIGLALTWAGRSWTPLAALSLFWLAVREAPWFFRPDQFRQMAVRIQEQFECTYGIRTNPILAGQPVPDHEVLALAGQSDSTFSEDYFVDTGALGAGKAMIARHHQTATWGKVGHARYARLNYSVAFAASLLIAAAAYLSDSSFQANVTRLIAPAAPFVVGRLQLARRHSQHSRARDEIRRIAESAIDDGASTPAQQSAESIARSIQDRLYHERLHEGRIPQWLYERWRDHDRETIDTASQTFADRLKAQSN